jgi:hypothetical protein
VVREREDGITRASGSSLKPVVGRLISFLVVSLHSLSIVDVLAAPQRNLHECFTLEQRRALMQQFRLAYISVQKLQEESGAAADQEADAMEAQP